MLIDWLVEEVSGLQQKGEDLVLATVLKKSGSVRKDDKKPGTASLHCHPLPWDRL
jgi:hypothetical protein